MSKAAELAALIGSQSALSNRNLIINGAMQVAQRSQSRTGRVTSDYYIADRWKIDLNSLGTWSFSQSSTAPDGFANSYKLDCTTADASPAAGDYLILQQRFEGQNLQMLKKGTSAAESVTVSFYIRSSVTGTYTCELYDDDNGRYIGKTFTVDAANTWERKTITFPGDTTGTLDDDNALSFFCQIWFGAGSNFNGGTFNNGTWGAGGNNTRVSSSNVNLASSTSNEAYVTGWQMEIGEQATPFEHRSFADELARCQRYCYVRGGEAAYELFMIATANGSATCTGVVQAPVKMRTRPTHSISSTANIDLYDFDGSAHRTLSGSGSLISSISSSSYIYIDWTTSGVTSGANMMVRANNTTDARFTLDAEL